MSWFSAVTSTAITLESLANSGNTRAQLVPELIGIPVVFSYNPESVTVKKKTKSEGERGTVTNGQEDAPRATGNTRISLKNAHVTGMGLTQLAVDQLLDWSTPVEMPNIPGVLSGAKQALRSTVDGATSLLRGGGKSLTSLPTQSTTRGTTSTGAAGVSTRVTRPVLRFVWGVGGPVGAGARVILESVDAKIRRFDWTGVPVWAEFNLELVLYDPPNPRQNPTSGGEHGRYKHLVTAGENVVRVATQTYGAPQAWRAVAEANGLDDPLRVRPGTVLTMPGAGELAEVSS